MEVTQLTQDVRLRSPATFLALLICACISCVSPSQKASHKQGPSLVLRIDSPRDHDQIYSASERVLVRGRIGLGGQPQREPVDLVLLLDVSAATDEPSGLDVDGDGELGFHPGRYLRVLQPPDYDLHCTDPDDTILAAEVAAATRLIEHAGEERGRITLLAFTTDSVSSSSQGAPAQWAPWRGELLHERLDQLRDGGKPRPLSQPAVLREILSARATHRDMRRVVALFAATPALPPGQTGRPHAHPDRAAPWSAALVPPTSLRSAGIELHTFGLGAPGASPPPDLLEFTESAGGVYRELRKLSDVAHVFTGDVADQIRGIEIGDPDSGNFATDVALSGDGSFSGHLALHEGRNRIQVRLDTSLPVLGDDGLAVDFVRRELTPWELLVELERLQGRNRDLFRLIEHEKSLRRNDFSKQVEFQIEP